MSASATPDEPRSLPWRIALLAALVAGAASLLAIGVLTAGFTLARPVVVGLGEERHRSVCRANLRRIGQALLAYQRDHGTLPPAWFADGKGKPIHSWRAMILPQLGEKTLHSNYDWNQSWDEGTNLTLHGRMPNYFVCPRDPNVNLGEVSYSVFTGPGTLFPDDQSRSLTDVPDPANTILLVESLNTTARSWLDPTDIPISRFRPEVNSGASSGLNSEHAGGVHVMTADGAIHFLPDLIEGHVLSRMVVTSSE